MLYMCAYVDTLVDGENYYSLLKINVGRLQSRFVKPVRDRRRFSIGAAGAVKGNMTL